MAGCSVRPEDNKKNFISATLILDFKDAFMTVPLHRSEQPYNCCEVPEGITRTRQTAFEGEVASGTFVVWRVLGFGGRPNPHPLCTGGIFRHEIHPVPCLYHEQHIRNNQKPGVR